MSERLENTAADESVDAAATENAAPAEASPAGAPEAPEASTTTKARGERKTREGLVVSDKMNKTRTG